LIGFDLVSLGLLSDVSERIKRGESDLYMMELELSFQVLRAGEKCRDA